MHISVVYVGSPCVAEVNNYNDTYIANKNYATILQGGASAVLVVVHDLRKISRKNPPKE